MSVCLGLKFLSSFYLITRCLSYSFSLVLCIIIIGLYITGQNLEHIWLNIKL